MKNKYKYSSGEAAVKRMREILGDLWRQIELTPFYNQSLESINRDYGEARYVALAFGKDVTLYPRRVRWRTNGSRCIGDCL